MRQTATDADGNKWWALREVRYEGDLTPLLAALAEKDDPVPFGQACTAMGEIVPDLWLVDASGRAVLVHRPVDECGYTKAGAERALAQLDVVSTKTTKIAPVDR